MPATKIKLNNTTGTRQCVTCSRSSGVLTCDGCRLTFCEQHIRKHRHELADQLEHIIHNHNVLRQDINQPTNEHFYLKKIDHWERESMNKIRLTAENARVNIRQILQKSKKRLTRISRALAFDIKSSCKADDFLENDLRQWTKQLNDLRLEIKSSCSLEVIEDQRSPIYLISITNTKLPRIRSNTNHSSSSSNYAELFFKATYPASVENAGLIAKHVGSNLDYGHIIGQQLYSKGSHTIRFKILQSTSPYTIFFGCISSQCASKAINYSSSFAVGWFGHNEIYQHGIWNNNVHIYGYNSNEIQTNDVLSLTFDCDRRQIRLLHERVNKSYTLAVNIDKAPFPWQLLVVLAHEDDCVKILTKT